MGKFNGSAFVAEETFEDIVKKSVMIQFTVKFHFAWPEN